MKISAAFPSDYLKAADLQDRNVLIKMDRVEMQKIGDDSKPVLYFMGKDKGLVLNKTNATNISVVYGDDTSDWHGQEIVLFPAMVDYQGKSVEAIRIRAPQPKDRPRREDPISSGPITPRRAVGGVSDNMQELNDEVPF